MNKLIWVITLSGIMGLSLQAQNKAFTVLIGTFLDAKKADFKDVADLGFVYAKPGENNLSSIYIGQYESSDQADGMAKKVLEAGFPNAVVKEKSLNGGQAVYVIQIAIRRINQEIEWAEFLEVDDNLALIIGAQQIKITTGKFDGIEAAKDLLTKAKDAGFEDAFIKRVNSAELNTVGSFELSDIKLPLIPLNLVDADSPARTKQKAKGVSTYSYNSSVAQARNLKQLAVPSIRGKIKRSSVLDLQKMLKGAAAYNGALDGYYGPNTENAFTDWTKQNRTFQKYLLLSQVMDKGPQQQGLPLQQLIDNMPKSRTPFGDLKNANVPLAFAYRAYLSFRDKGPSNEVNMLMNSALKGAYGKRQSGTLMPVDPSANYAYNDLNQLLLHLLFIHSDPNQSYKVPCWLFEQHPSETAQATNTLNNYPGYRYEKQSCNQFIDWPAIKMLETIATDLNVDQQLNQRRISSDAAARNDLYVAKQPIAAAEKKALEDWNNKLWLALDGWGARDPYNKNIVWSLKAAYLQSLILLEDHYMNQGLSKNEAHGLALATVHTVVGYHLERFVA